MGRNRSFGRSKGALFKYLGVKSPGSYLNDFVVPASLRRKRLASADALFAAASSGFAFALLIFARSFFAAAFSPDESFGAVFSGCMISDIVLQINYFSKYLMRHKIPTEHHPDFFFQYTSNCLFIFALVLFGYFLLFLYYNATRISRKKKK